jgi:uncharacterized SAM-binding protein YcdF (DUF218 family)
MIRYFIGIILIITLTIIGLSVYLQPDDLSNCGNVPSSGAKCQKVDAIVAVSGGDTNARAREAVKLFESGWSDKLIFSGAAQDKSGPSNAREMKVLAISEGVPESSISIEEYSETTKQNAENVQTIFSKLDIRSVILVTSGYHQRRASLEFNKRTKDVTIINHPVKTDKDWSWWWWTSLRGWWLALSETIKIGVFYVTGVWS